MFFLVQYARVVHGIRRYLTRTGLLAAVERRAESSRWALWFRSLFSVLDFADFVELETPWWTLASGRRVKDFLLTTPQPKALEWGSGASTVWLGNLCSTVVSIESDDHWAKVVRESVGPHVTILEPDVPERVHPLAVRSKRWGFRSRDFTNYVNAVDGVEGDFDLIVIDGRAREACLDVAIRRLRPGGIILFDNTNRRRYRTALARHKDSLVVHRDIGLTPILPWPTETSVLSLVTQPSTATNQHS